MMQTMADGTDPSNFEIYVMSDGLLLVCVCCDTDLLRPTADLLLLDLTDAARAHVCDPRKVEAIKELNWRHKESMKG